MIRRDLDRAIGCLDRFVPLRRCAMRTCEPERVKRSHFLLERLLRGADRHPSVTREEERLPCHVQDRRVLGTRLRGSVGCGACGLCVALREREIRLRELTIEAALPFESIDCGLGL